jgi:glycosyltransferase involved in cell wall biosynthesis
MPSITALLHTHNDAMRLGRCLETLYPCDQIVIIDHDSSDATVGVALAYGASVFPAAKTKMWGRAHSPVQRSKAPQPRHKASPLEILMSAETVPGWILRLDPRESVSEGLAASLFELKSQPTEGPRPYSLFLREETADGWLQHPTPQTRLVPPTWIDWNEWNDGGEWNDRNEPLPHADAAAVLEGELLRFTFP